MSDLAGNFGSYLFKDGVCCTAGPLSYRNPAGAKLAAAFESFVERWHGACGIPGCIKPRWFAQDASGLAQRIDFLANAVSAKRFEHHEAGHHVLYFEGIY